MFDWIDLVNIFTSLGYGGAFLVGFIGTAIPYFPTYLIIPFFGVQLNPFIVGIVTGVGSGIGQFLHYYIGVFGRRFFPEDLQVRFDKWSVRFGGRIFWLILFLAATPFTPDDLIWIPLGLMKYPKLRALSAGITGKIILNLIYGLIGYYGLSHII